jgi:putative DNA primase/helicase
LHRGDKVRRDLRRVLAAGGVVAARGNDFLWVRERKEWIVWDGRRWAPGDDGDVREALREVMRTIHRDAEFTSDVEEQKAIGSFARASQNKTRIDGAMQAVQDKLRVREEDLDTDPWVLNVENGTIDLRTGELRRHDRADKITKLAPVRYDPKAKAPRFTKFLKQIFVDDELTAFVRRFLGYSLTGSTEERAMAVMHGVGKNGKSTLVELFIDLMGDYASVADPRTVVRDKYSDVTTQYQLAELDGVRFVGMAETKRNVQLEENTVKHITGRDTIPARRPYGRPFSYRPQFKIWMSTNHKPEIPDGSEGIWDRLRLIPFTQRFEGKKADTRLPEKLREELAGVLAWAVRGCVEWVQHGLGTSAAVDAATAEYRSETDPIERFLVDECELGKIYFVTKRDLRAAWDRWAQDEDVEHLSPQDFTGRMREKGVVRNFREGKSRSGDRGWRGIGLRSDRKPPSPEEVSAPETSANVQKNRARGHFSEESQKFSELPSTHEDFGKNEEEVSAVSADPQDDYVEPPVEFEVDGTKVELGTWEVE